MVNPNIKLTWLAKADGKGEEKCDSVLFYGF